MFALSLRHHVNLSREKKRTRVKTFQPYGCLLFRKHQPNHNPYSGSNACHSKLNTIFKGFTLDTFFPYSSVELDSNNDEFTLIFSLEFSNIFNLNFSNQPSSETIRSHTIRRNYKLKNLYREFIEVSRKIVLEFEFQKFTPQPQLIPAL